MGKCRLCAEFVERLEAREPATPPIAARALSPLRRRPHLLAARRDPQAHAGVRDTDPPALALEKVRAGGRELLSSSSRRPARAMAALAYTVGVEDPDVPAARAAPPGAGRDPAAWRSSSPRSAQAPRRRRGRGHPLGRPALLDLLEEIAERVQRALLSLPVAARADVARRPGWGGGAQLRQHRARAARRRRDRPLVAPSWRSTTCPRVSTTDPSSGREGNPFFLEEIVRRLIDERPDRPRRMAAGARSVASGREIPDTRPGGARRAHRPADPLPKRALQQCLGRRAHLLDRPDRAAARRDDAGDLDDLLDRGPGPRAGAGAPIVRRSRASGSTSSSTC